MNTLLNNQEKFNTMKSQSRWLTFSIIFILFNCNLSQPDEATSPLFVLQESEQTGVHFSNKIFETTDLNIINFEYLYNGAGIGAGDFNNDGLIDLYFAGNMVEGKLYVNKGNFKFEDITPSSGIQTNGKWGTGVSLVDLNSDGLPDLYLCFAGPYGPEQRKNLLYINNGDLTFSEKAAEYGLDISSHSTQAAFLDYDRDGDLDLYLLNNITEEIGPNVIRKKKVNGEHPNTDQLYRNENGYFINVSKEAGILIEGYGLGLAVGDLNQDNWPDIFVSNDYLSNDLLYINNGNGTFTDRAADFFKHTSYSSMGCDLADFNNDGRLDIVAVDMLPPDNKRRKLMLGSINYHRFRSELLTGYSPQYMRNTLQLNQGPSPDGGGWIFSEIGQLAGVHSTDWSWSPLLEDLDNDGFRDLVVTNGYPRDITNLDFASYKANVLINKQYNETVLLDLIKAVNEVDGAYLPNFVFQNQGNLTFSDRSSDWGFDQPSYSHGAVLADLDNDGDLDYVTNNSYDKVFIYENTARQQTSNHYLQVTLQGPAGNLNGLGAKIWAHSDSLSLFHEHYPFRGFQSTLSPVAHFGLGNKDKVDSLVIQWPDETRQVIYDVQVDQNLKVAYTPALL